MHNCLFLKFTQDLQTNSYSDHALTSTRIYLWTISMCGNNFAILWKLPYSVHLWKSQVFRLLSEEGDNLQQALNKLKQFLVLQSNMCMNSSSHHILTLRQPLVLCTNPSLKPTFYQPSLKPRISHWKARTYLTRMDNRLMFLNKGRLCLLVELLVPIQHQTI